MSAWNSSHATVLPDEVNEAPPPIPLLNVWERERSNVRPSGRACQQWRARVKCASRRVDPASKPDVPLEAVSHAVRPDLRAYPANLCPAFMV
jgi:hypothetical protein